MKKYLLSLLVLATVAGCASPEREKQQALELLAQKRANLLAKEVPVEFGPLSIMKARAKGSVVEIMMIDSGNGSISTKQMVETSVKSYCTDMEVRPLLEEGLSYRIMVRNARGQLQVDQFITSQTCTEVL
ncbi:GspS/AspS pilotin family protein [Vibrio sp. Of7-15]|uniref:GspS/AspS pilotin family protein n=1 Tax=Vibrio sp. Of7-15 TaxID=2724879 RepID=UPI001EF24369|nr:GspS/AspS pilotin family protein [Vibrio sp. Of7-15]MCG7496060.1 GspS/AspS pilotin family protein [Vibrio sp. Of7-15]